jgi:hypothetical protein
MRATDGIPAPTFRAHSTLSCKTSAPRSYPTRVEPINQADLLHSRPFLQLRFTSDCIAHIAIVLVDQFFAFEAGNSFNLLTYYPQGLGCGVGRSLGNGVGLGVAVGVGVGVGVTAGVGVGVTVGVAVGVAVGVGVG